MKELNVWAVIKFRRILKHLFNFGIGSGQKLLQHETCGLPAAGRPVSGNPWSWDELTTRGRRRKTAPCVSSSFPPSLPASVPPPPVGRSVLAVGRSFGRSPPPSLPLAHSLPFPSSNSCRSARPLSGREQGIFSACQVGN